MSTLIKILLLGLMTFSAAFSTACTRREVLIGTGAAAAGAVGGWYAHDRWGGNDNDDD